VDEEIGVLEDGSADLAIAIAPAGVAKGRLDALPTPRDLREDILGAAGGLVSGRHL
jgi:hypothetical protein